MTRETLSITIEPADNGYMVRVKIKDKTLIVIESNFSCLQARVRATIREAFLDINVQQKQLENDNETRNK